MTSDRATAVTEVMRKLASGMRPSDDDPAFLEAGASLVGLRANQHVYNAGETIGGFFVVQSGVLCDKLHVPGAISHVSRLYLPGHVFGLRFLGTGKATSTVVTSSPSALWVLDELLIREMLSHNSGIVAYGRLIRAAMEEEDHQRLLLAHGDAKRRMAYLLLKLAGPLSEGSDAPIGLIPFAQTIIADHLGLTPIHVGRTLKALEEEGLIFRDQRTYTILLPAELRRLALLT